MPDAANQMFYFESGFQAVYYMIIISIVGIGTFITIYTMFSHCSCCFITEEYTREGSRDL